MLLQLALVTQFLYHASAFSVPPLPRPNTFVGAAQAQKQQQPLHDTLDAWVEREEQIALDKLLANVAPGGRNVEGKGVVAGTVVASPSQEGPDYWYQWVRDAAITMNTLVDIYADDLSSTQGSDMSTILDAYASLQHKIQHTSNPSGTFADLSGLGEPKFAVDGTPFTGSWGRPQRDGPALRALTLMHYLREYNASHPSLWSSDSASSFYGPFYRSEMPPNSVIKADLEYISHTWNQSSFDLWEEVEGLHFFTLITSARSLREGSRLARSFGDHGAAEWYAEQAGYAENLLRRFWNTRKGHLVETLWSKRSGLDCGVLLGSLHALPATNSPDEPIYPPWSDEILVSLLALTRDQKTRFPINNSPSDAAEPEAASHAFTGTGLGRYPEDVYDGYATSSGNPWFLCTASAAEILFRTAAHVSAAANITVSHTSLPFWSALLTASPLDVAARTYGPGDAQFDALRARLLAAGDEFLAVVRAHVDKNGAMSEQFDRETGYMTGARDLTWSYGAFLQAARARRVARGL